MAMSEDEDISTENISKLYRTPGHPIAFSSPFTVYQFFKGKVPLAKVKAALEHIDSYTLHREYKRPAEHNMYYSHERRKQFQADLIDISNLKRTNQGVTFLLVIIDVFSRKIWVMPLKSKSAQSSSAAFQDWIESLRGDLKQQAQILTDSGTEFYNRMVKEVMESAGIKLVKAKNIYKAAIAERVNKTIQVLIYKYLTDKGTDKYIDVLDRLIHGYNSKKHQTLKYQFTPNDADAAENEAAVRSIHMLRAGSKAMRNAKRRLDFKIGDQVRIKTHGKAPSSARRAYVQQFHGELFVITGVNRKMPIPMYTIKSLDTEEEVAGGFYANELVHVRGDLFKIDKIIRREGRGRNRRALVRWKYFGPRWDSWIYERDIVDV